MHEKPDFDQRELVKFQVLGKKVIFASSKKRFSTFQWNCLNLLVWLFL
jgi:hypothetical protein